MSRISPASPIGITSSSAAAAFGTARPNSYWRSRICSIVISAFEASAHFPKFVLHLEPRTFHDPRKVMGAGRLDCLRGVRNFHEKRVLPGAADTAFRCRLIADCDWL